MVKVTLKWGKETHDMEIDTSDSVETFQFQIYSLTKVPPERQTIMGIPGGKLKTTDDLSKKTIKEGAKITLMGTAEGGELKEPPATERTKFAEDMSAEEIAKALNEVAKGPLPVGLVNLGNTCYMNSCIQMLRRVPELHEAMAKKYSGGLPTGDLNADTMLAHEFHNLIKMMGNSVEPVQPMRFLVALRAKVPSFGEMAQGRPQQQDAEECIRNMLAAFAAAMPCKSEDGEETNSVDALFGFKTQSVYKCVEADEEPEQTSLTTDRFLFCHFGSTTEPISHVREGIKMSLKETVEKNSSFLGRSAQYTKTAALQTLPQYLLVQFARFGWKAANSEAGTSASRVKIGRKVQFPKKLDLFEFTAEGLQKELQQSRQKASEQRDRDWEQAQKSLKEGTNLEVQIAGAGEEERLLDTGAFELISVVSHQGRSADGGHYVGWAISEKGEDKKKDAKKKRPGEGVKEDDTWLLFDDEKVSERLDRDVDLAGGRLDTHIAYFCLYKKAPTRIIETVGGKGNVLGSAEAPSGEAGSSGGSGEAADPKPMDVDSSGAAS